MNVVPRGFEIFLPLIRKNYILGPPVRTPTATMTPWVRAFTPSQQRIFPTMPPAWYCKLGNATTTHEDLAWAIENW